MGRRSLKYEAYGILILLIIVFGFLFLLCQGLLYILNLIINAIEQCKNFIITAWNNPDTKKFVILSIIVIIVFIVLIIFGIYYLRKKLLQKKQEKIRKAEEERRIKEAERLKKEYQHGYRDDMTGYEYETYCADLFNYCGWKAETTPKSGDFGADVIATKGNIKIVVQCKKWKGSVGFDAVKEVFTAKTINKADYAIVITNSRFSKAAKKAANDTGVILVRHPDLKETLERLFY